MEIEFTPVSRENTIAISSLPLSDISTHIDKAARNVVEYYVGRNLRLATAESCTGGLLSGRITSVSGSSKMFECGIVSYSERIKSSVLGVPNEVIERYGVVSPETAEAMAKGVLNLSDADVGIGITGIAGPDGGTDFCPVGTIFVSVIAATRPADKAAEISYEYEHTINLALPHSGVENEREINRLSAVLYALGEAYAAAENLK